MAIEMAAISPSASASWITRSISISNFCNHKVNVSSMAYSLINLRAILPQTLTACYVSTCFTRWRR
ncbi:Uncharacterised protein [Vibrio cholerae]|nr:Uncharacterised protein [Vibrio cholerae]CSC86098.1 Uncharacterised protein [Vibrio cholerae]CSD40003.1 Uncharacterised protein [Vibrio cholerae]CSI54453.1 Uncharacterised protein [Vibrio cholerae]